MHRYVIVALSLVVIVAGGLLLYPAMGQESTPVALMTQAITSLPQDSAYQGEISLQLTVKPQPNLTDPVHRLVLESLRELVLSVDLHKTAGQDETANLRWRGQTIPLDGEPIAAAWWEQFTPGQLLSKDREKLVLAGDLSVSPVLPVLTSQADAVSLLLQDLTTGLERLPATLTLHRQRQGLSFVYQVQSLEFSWSQTLTGEDLTRFPLGELTASAGLVLNGRLDLLPPTTPRDPT